MQGIFKEGLVKKQGHIIKNFKERWLELTYDKLVYLTRKDGEFKGEIQIHKFMYPFLNKTFKVQPCFTVESDTHKFFHFVAENEREAESWVASIELVIAIRAGVGRIRDMSIYNTIYNNYILISELLYQHNKNSIQEIVNIMKDAIAQNVYTLTECLKMIVAIQKRRKIFTIFYVDTITNLLRSMNVQLDRKQVDILRGMETFLIKRGFIDKEIPDKHKNLTDEEIVLNCKSGGMKYVVFKDDLDKFKEIYDSLSESDQWAALAFSIKVGSPNIFKFLLKKGHKIHSMDYHKAFLGGNQEILAALDFKKYELSPETMNKLVERHILDGYRELAKDFPPYSYNWSSATESFNFKQFFEKVFAAPDLNYSDESFSNALIEASRYGFTSICKLLVDFGSSVERTNLIRQTPFMEAVIAGNFETADFLLEKNSDINFQNAKGQTALYLCADFNRIKAVDYLLSHGADMNIANEKLQTPFLRCIIKSFMDLARTFLSKKCDVSMVDEKGFAAIHYCSMYGLMDMLNELIENGVDINMRDGEMNTPVFIACKNKRFDVVKILISNGADYNAPNNVGKVPLLASIEEHDEKTALYLLEKGVKMSEDNVAACKDIANKFSMSNVLTLLYKL
ncbi:PH domain containing protein [Trichomonas vaginalis G3]|uniref:PH domain containing protein n=1 Tax=Trichomonas vaginalis (strain ATCC PRA-98 / G3) TaxID=412133 RepID=A2E191_TRIV3|nr:spectrin binding [Trichomonas vaginalis G3]EAY13592.1 PH domain containing protein [Trichomonas vaginalis G3]KAI5486420.1 spectrin binding [Trichomonas vaginalis G3]|eukprot:XP_001325815.1 PH domain containing protein [Trichomonas vaginalis G3]